MVDGAVPGADGQLYMALNVGAFEEVAKFKGRVDTVIRQIRTSRPAQGTERLYAPGGLEAEIAEVNASTGIPLNEETVRGIRQAAVRLGVRDRLFR